MKTPKIRFSVSENEGEFTLNTWINENIKFTGWIDFDDETITYTENIAPSDIGSTEGEDFLANLDTHIEDLNNIRKLLQALKPQTNIPLDDILNIETDFYLSEGDLNIRITIDFNHPLLLEMDLMKLKPTSNEKE